MYIKFYHHIWSVQWSGGQTMTTPWNTRNSYTINLSHQLIYEVLMLYRNRPAFEAGSDNCCSFNCMYSRPQLQIIATVLILAVRILALYMKVSNFRAYTISKLWLSLTIYKLQSRNHLDCYRVKENPYPISEKFAKIYRRKTALPFVAYQMITGTTNARNFLLFFEVFRPK